MVVSRRFRWCTAAMLACATLLGACRSAPTFRVTDVRMTDETEDGYVLTFTLVGTNTNEDALPLRRVRYALSLDGDRVFRGTRSAEATIPAKGEQALTLPVAVRTSSEADSDDATGSQTPGAVPYRISGSVEYVLPGSIAELLFDSRIRIPKAGFGESGTFEFTD